MIGKIVCKSDATAFYIAFIQINANMIFKNRVRMRISLRNIRADARIHTFPHTQNYGLRHINMSAVACTFGL